MRPGDVYFFSGANPHMVLCAGVGVHLTTYESYMSLHREHMAVFNATNEASVHPSYFHMRDSTLKDIKGEIADAVSSSPRLPP